jgi:hypothetical protein
MDTALYGQIWLHNKPLKQQALKELIHIHAHIRHLFPSPLSFIFASFFPLLLFIIFHFILVFCSLLLFNQPPLFQFSFSLFTTLIF